MVLSPTHGRRPHRIRWWNPCGWGQCGWGMSTRSQRAIPVHLDVQLGIDPFRRPDSRGGPPRIAAPAVSIPTKMKRNHKMLAGPHRDRKLRRRYRHAGNPSTILIQHQSNGIFCLFWRVRRVKRSGGRACRRPARSLSVLWLPVSPTGSPPLCRIFLPVPALPCGKIVVLGRTLQTQFHCGSLK